ncbi:tetratricopeptide repeat protein [Bacteroides caecigallinarum]|uniref:tetratricopeptide repeat protein n=1 Tax=Bacteroides caecigallinarum TaxID=1411144 RepID=UPI001F349C65|nr:tetratricopeptide repeat protein [Bacteroides caecigallinarum]MCF2594118.1 tetratricopeptide repeat protein [Bacteroides caecigallinarum]
MNRMYVLVMLLACILLPANASLKTEADKAYQENDFKGAIEKYEAILEGGQESADMYYNLGNSYYKNKDIAKAVLNYERALLLSPGDEDIRYNLEMAKSKTIDKVTPKSEIFIVTWVNSIRDLMSESSWAGFAVVCFIFFLLGTSAYIFGNKIVIRKTGFSLAVVFLVLTVVANMFADSQKDKLVNRTGAIIMQPSVTVKSTPDDSGTDLFVLHEGTKVYINDNSMKGWKEVSLEDGSRGWVSTESIEVI